MFELTEYLPKTRSLNEELINGCGVEIVLTNTHTITLKNKNCKIEFVTGKYYLDFLFFMSINIDNKKIKKYDVIELFEIENIVVIEVLSNFEQVVAKELTDDIERYIYIYSIIIQKKLTKYFKIKQVD